MNQGNGILNALGRNTDVLLAVAVVSILVFMILPLPPFLLDILIALNITLSIVVLLISMYITSPLELSVFPGLLLILTLFRLSLNVASTRLILGDGYAGKIIFAFGSFVVKGNYVVGFIVFIILVIIQFVVITKGAGRIAEVAARFTLDAMPGKQMSIDADLNAGIITEEEARKRREMIQREAEFYGAMDGASKFVRGDAIAGLIITVVNIVGGLIIGVLQRGMTFQDALQTYTLLTIGDGLVSQIPALIISVSAGMVVTRNASGNQFDVELKGQIFQRPKALLIASGVLAFFAIVPGLPMFPFLVLSVVSGVAGYLGTKLEKVKVTVQEVKPQKQTLQQEEKVEKLIQVDPIEVEIGYGLIPLADEEQGGTLFKRIIGIRKQLALELGIIVPPVRVRDNIHLQPNEYVIKIRGNKVASWEVKPGFYLAMNPGTAEGEIGDGIKVKEPVYGFDAYWIPPHRKEEVEVLGYTVVEPVSVIATHLIEILRRNAGKILSRQDVKVLIDSLREDYPALVEEINAETLPIGTIQKVLQNLLGEGIPIRDMVTILEALLDYSRVTKNVDVLTEYVRHSLSETIARLYQDDNGVIHAIQLDPRIEEIITQALQQGASQTQTLGLPPNLVRAINNSVEENVEIAKGLGHAPVVICSATVRLYFYRLIHSSFPDVSVISYTELPTDVDIEIIGRIKINNGA
jgi:flagellar biosynthesis protein FlhA